MKGWTDEQARESYEWLESKGIVPSETVMHNAAGACQPGYHRQMPGGNRCRCGEIQECLCSTYGKRYCPIHHEELRPPT